MFEGTLLFESDQIIMRSIAWVMEFYGEGEAEYATALMVARFECYPWADSFRWDLNEGKIYAGKSFNPHWLNRQTVAERIYEHLEYIHDFPAMVQAYSKLLPRRYHGFLNYFLRRMNKDFARLRDNPRKHLEAMINHMCQMKAYNRLALMDDSLNRWLTQGIKETQEVLSYARRNNELVVSTTHVYDMVQIINKEFLRVVKYQGSS